MVKKLQFKRLVWLTVLLAMAFAGLGYRLVDLQVVRHGELSKEARSNTQYTFRLEPRRGDILDCKNNLLATSVFVKTVCADPSLLSNHVSAVAQAIAPLLALPENDLEKRITPRTQSVKNGKDIPVKYVLLKRKVSSDTWEKIQETMTNLSFGLDEKRLSKKDQAALRDLRTKAIFTDPVDDQLRNYPNGLLAAHVIGYMGIADETNNGVREQVSVGVDGIERKFDGKLRGVPGWRLTERDSRDREVVTLREQEVAPHDGLNVVLTIDSVLQSIVESSLADGMRKHSPVSISGMIIRPRTGEILAMATLPNYDPNNPGAYPVAARNNRIITDVEEPGSTFKIVVVSGALNDHTVKLTDEFDCQHGKFFYAGKWLHDHITTCGIIPVKEIITKSSNIGAAKIGILMGEQRVYDYMRGFGFGTSTGIPLPAESRGIVHNVTNWTKLSISRIPMGHEVGVTCLQMAMAMSAVANKGVLMQPMLVDRLVESDGTVAVKYYPQQVRRVISEEAARDMTEALKSVVTSDGTAIGAAMTNYTVAGKTGTAQENDGHTYSNEKFFASFIGFFPADNPEICIYVGLDAPHDGHVGGIAAAPVFKEIAVQAANYLNIRPDKGNATGLPEMSAPPSSAPTTVSEATTHAVMARMQ
ncbi:MAG TPA: penicillin-binding protein 2 [Verrucomicrobiae bacterium]|jgi:cell division protein FtsI/penicillin-binding protein 2|nr:penicillin-binding protein 2 [Verrucomicrobiae bacterium]